jgi:hypothetical protein
VKHLSCICSNKLRVESSFFITPLIFSNLKDFRGKAEISSCSCGLVQKRKSSQYLRDLETAYSDYTESSFSISGTTPLPVLEFGSKHESIAEWILRETLGNKAESSKLLDWGCGNLDLLLKIEEKSKDIKLELFGYDKYTTPVNRPPSSRVQLIDINLDSKVKDVKFDYISLIHTLEHFADLDSELKSVSSFLKTNGKIFVQVPNLKTNPFDIYVADHLYHFTPSSIFNLLHSRGFEILDLNSRISKKEISIVAKKNHVQFSRIDRSDIDKVNHLEPFYRLLSESWTRALISLDQKSKLAIYGIGTAGTWFHRLARDLGIEICFFIDDNKQTSRYKFNDIPIIGNDALDGKIHPDIVILPFETPLAIEKSLQLKRIGISSMYFDFDTNQIKIIH